MPDSLDAKELVYKLVTTFHLSVPERAVFFGEPVPGSLVQSGILAISKSEVRSRLDGI